jgi:HlyD family secretion protein
MSRKELKHMTLGRKAVLVATVIVVITVLVVMLGGNEPDSAEASYQLVKIDRGAVTATVSATGTLNPLVTVQVGSQVSGNIQHLHADFNSRVRKGDVIAQIEPSLFQAQKAKAEANLRSAKAALDRAGVTLRDAERQLKRTKDLSKRNMVSDSELDATQLAYDQAVVDFKVQEAGVAEAQAALQLAEVNLAHTTIYAPIDGIVISRDVDVGQTVAASLQAPTLFTIAQDLSQMQIEADVDEAFIGTVREGQPVTFTVYAYPERTFQGKLAQIRLNPNLEQDVVIYKSIVEVDNEDLSLKPGMTATVSIEVARRDDILRVNTSALRFVPELPPEQLDGLRADLALARNEVLLWKSTENGLQPVKAKIGLVGETKSEISGDGIEEGVEVAVPGKRKAGESRRGWGLRLF